MLKNKCYLYVIISIRFFSITICNLLIESPSYLGRGESVVNFMDFIQESVKVSDSVHVVTSILFKYIYSHKQFILCK